MVERSLSAPPNTTSFSLTLVQGNMFAEYVPDVPGLPLSFVAQPGPECSIGIARGIACTVCMAASAHL
jgi:hypothetical protein